MNIFNRKPTRVNMQFVSAEKQYADIDLSLATKIVQAEYVMDPLEPDNPMICALPRQREPKEMISTGNLVPIPYEELIKLPYNMQLEYLAKLRDLHYVLPMEVMLETAIYYSLRLSYSHRKHLSSEDASVEYTMGNVKYTTNRKLIGFANGAAFPGFELIGKSGSGKTTGIDKTLSRIPQVIIHFDEKGQPFLQIVYLVVNCPGNSNYRALLERIGQAIDKALGNTDMCYELIFKEKKKTIGQLINDLIKIVENLGIGIIILDEIQNLSRCVGIENSIGNLLQTGNETKMTFGVVGTRYSEEHLLNQIDDFQGRRRLGIHIQADNYCYNEDFFKGMVEWLFQYQLFTPRVQPDEKIIRILYENTSGIIDCLISLFTYVNMEYVIKASLGLNPEINEEFIQSVADKYFKEILSLIKKNILEPDEEDDLRVLLDLATRAMRTASIKEMQYTMTNGSPRDSDSLIESATDSLHIIWKNHFNRESIHQKVKVEAKALEKKNSSIDIAELMSGANSRLLRARKTDARKVPFEQGKNHMPVGDSTIQVDF